MRNSLLLLVSEPLNASTIAMFALLALSGIVCAGLFAGLETGMYKLSRVRLSIRAARGDASAARLASEYARPKRMLSTLLVANALAGWCASFGTSKILDGLGYTEIQAVALDLVILVPVVFLFGEVLPKDLFRVHADRWMPRYAMLLTVVRIAFTVTGIVPLVVGLSMIATRLFATRQSGELIEARARVSALLAEGAGSGGLSETQLGFAERVFTMRGITVAQEMTPWKLVATISSSASHKERARAFLTSGASRLPVLDGTGSVIGVIASIDQIQHPLASTRELMRHVPTLLPTLTALEAIQAIRRERVQLAIVAERADRPLGIVSMKDLVEPLVGNLGAW